jgi:hypothetical protein
MTDHRPVRAEQSQRGWTVRCAHGDHITTPPQPSEEAALIVFAAHTNSLTNGEPQRCA